jgi:NAD(P)-dependent dehydrogenase (short-subunit alcohol dehydrogenase family)
LDGEALAEDEWCMERKTAVITGARRPLGLGFAVARHLAELDFHVILAARALPEVKARAGERREENRAATALLAVLTTTLAAALADTPVVIDAVDPGRVASHPERGDDAEDRPAAEAARRVIVAATLAPGGPSGRLFVEGRFVEARASERSRA